MINLFDKNNNRIEPIASKKFPVGKDIKNGLKRFKANIAIPFSTHHQYQRRDSFWANNYVTPIELMSEGFINDKDHKLLPAFQKVIFKDGNYLAENLNPRKIIINSPIHESNFGDNWDETLSKKQIKNCKDYFQSIESLFLNFQSIKLLVGGQEYEMLSGSKGKTKIKFSVPKTSLMKAIRREIFDDLLIGNFMKTQIINGSNLYNPDFTSSVAKYSDNGRVKTKNELEKYFNYYKHSRSKKDALFKKITFIRNKARDLIGINNITKLKYLLRK